MDTQEHAGKPKAGRDEAEGLSGLPLAAVAAIGETTPLKGTAATNFMTPVDERAERSKPGEAKKAVERIM